MNDALFQAIERMQGRRPWGSMLDAGTGEHSLEWITSLPTDRWTAVTADPARTRALSRRFHKTMRPADRVLTGLWSDPTLLFEDPHTTVLADYLLGAVDGFAPYTQDQLFARLRPLVGQTLYVVGQQPYPESATTAGGQAILDIARLRDACILLAGHRTYREYPLDWVVRHLEGAGFQVTATLRLPIVYRRRFIDGQLDLCLRKLRYLPDPTVTSVLSGRVEALRAHALRIAETAGGIRWGEDYLIASQPTD